MKHQIWKYPLSICNHIQMPEHSEILSVQVQNGTICLWAKVDPDLPKVGREFICVGTGISMPAIGVKFIDTVQLNLESNGSTLVFHVFEKFN